MSFRDRVVLLVVAGLMICRTNMDAQILSASLRGVVRNTTGTVVPSARVVADNPGNKSHLEVLTDDQGRYLFPSLPPGEFTVTVEAKGFRPGVYSKVVLEINQLRELDISLQAGDAAAGPVTTNAAGMATVPLSQLSRTFSQSDFEFYPLLARLPVTLGIFQPGVQVNGGNEGTSRVNGTRQGSNNLDLDSTDVNDPVVPAIGLSLAAVNTDSVEQVRIVTAGAQAEYGRNTGAQILLVTRSGGNRWAGSAYDYLQNATLNANDFFNNALDAKRPKDNQNVFGFSAGGPLIKNRTFLFGNYEGNRFNKEIVRNRAVLTTDAKSGLFTYIPRAQGTSISLATFDILKNDPRGLGIDPRIAEALKSLPDPNNGHVGDGLNTAGYLFDNPIDGRKDQFTIRVDHNLTANHRISYRNSWSQDNQVDWQHNADATFPGQQSGREKRRQWGFSLASDWAVSTRTLNEFRFGRQSLSDSLLRPARLSGPMIVSGLWTDPLNPDFPSDRGSRLYQFADNVSFIRGKHAFKGGIDVRFTSQNLSDEAGTWPDVTFGTSFGNVPPASIGPSTTLLFSPDQRQTFELLYNALLGRMEQVSQTYYSNLKTFQASGTPRVRDYNFREYGFFLQDEWKLLKNLTINLGVRYELSEAPTENNLLQGTLDQTSSLTGQSKQIEDISVQPGGTWYKTDTNNVGPRFGFAYRPARIDGLTIRGGYGVFYDRLVGAAANFVDANTPGFAQTATIFPNQAGNDVRLRDGIPIPVPAGAPTKTPPVTRSTTAAIFDPGLQNGYIQEFNLTVQKEVYSNTVAEVSYVGTRGRDLFMNLNSNQVKTAGDFLRSFKEIQAFRTSLTPVPTNNTLVRLFGSVDGAVRTIGGSTFDQALVGVAADTVDRTYFSRYSAAGLSDFYLRNFPQFNQLIAGTSRARSYYDSLQVRVRHQRGGLNVVGSYTWSKSLDTVSVDGGGFTSPIANFNLSLNKGRSDADRPHVVTGTATYDMPPLSWLNDAPRWFAEMIGGWRLGLLTIWESGAPFTVSSGRQTATTGIDSWANYTGNRNIGSVIRSANGIFYFYSEQVQAFTFPAAGEIGTSGRNSFRGPQYFDIDLSVAKNFRISESHRLSLRIEAYNVMNRSNFGLPEANLSSPVTFGRINSTVGNPRTLQIALRYSF